MHSCICSQTDRGATRYTCPPLINVSTVNVSEDYIVAKFEECNLKFKKVLKKFEIHIRAQLLTEDTQYSQYYCNSVFG